SFRGFEWRPILMRRSVLGSSAINASNRIGLFHYFRTTTLVGRSHPPTYLPTPVTPMVRGLLLALPLIAAVALAGPGEVGAKLTTTEHFPFGPIWPLQLVEAENSLDPETLLPVKVTVAPPFFFAVLTSVTPFALLLPTLTVPKFKELLETRTIADA